MIQLIQNGVLVIPLDADVDDPSAAYLIAVIRAIVAIEPERWELLRQQMAHVQALQDAGDPGVDPYFRVTRTAFAALEEVRTEHALVAREVGDDLD